jgi:hypothetical protein
MNELQGVQEIVWAHRHALGTGRAEPVAAFCCCVMDLFLADRPEYLVGGKPSLRQKVCMSDAMPTELWQTTPEILSANHKDDELMSCI